MAAVPCAQLPAKEDAFAVAAVTYEDAAVQEEGFIL